MVEHKPLTKSKTAGLGAVYVTGGILITILQILDQIDPILASINMAELPPDAPT